MNRHFSLVYDNQPLGLTHPVAVELASYPVTPIVTVYTPSGAAYLAVTPDAAALEIVVRPRVPSESLIYAGVITHKIADTTNAIAAADATNLATSKTLAAEIQTDVPAHSASTTYHIAPGVSVNPCHKAKDTVNTIAAADMSDLATGYVLVDELFADHQLHTGSTTYHNSATAAQTDPGTPNTEAKLVTKANLVRTGMLAHYGGAIVHDVADVINLALVTATTVATDQATAQTLLNLLKAYHGSHIACFDTTDLAGVVAIANSKRTGLLVHFAATAVHGGIADATNLATLTAVSAASDQTTANTLLNALKATANLHLAVTDNGAYQTLAPWVALVWGCLGRFFCKTSVSAGVFVISEFRSE